MTIQRLKVIGFFVIPISDIPDRFDVGSWDNDVVEICFLEE